MTHSDDSTHQTRGRSEDYVRSQYERLGYFLIASAFLVTAFVQLVTADTGSMIVAEGRSIILVHAVSALGSTIAGLYLFMNLWLVITRWLAEKSGLQERTEAHVLHTVVIPAFFMAFWLAAWYQVTMSSCVFWSLGFIVLLFIFQMIRERARLRGLCRSHSTR